MQNANRHDLRLLLRRLAPSERDSRRILGFFRRVLRQLTHPPTDRIGTAGRLNHPNVTLCFANQGIKWKLITL